MTPDWLDLTLLALVGAAYVFLLFLCVVRLGESKRKEKRDDTAA